MRGVFGGVADGANTSRTGAFDFFRIIGVVCQGADGEVVSGGDESVVVRSLEVHVEYTTAPDTVHNGTETHRHAFELARLGSVTSIFREQVYNWVESVIFCSVLVTECLKTGVSTEPVDVVTKGIHGAQPISAVEIVRKR